MSEPSRRAYSATAVFLALFVVYQVNGDFLVGNDAKPNVYLALDVLQDGSITFTPRRAPFMFQWRLANGADGVPVRIRSWEDRVQGRRAGDLLESGRLVVERERYYLVPTLVPGHYVSMYGPGTGLVAAPAFGALSLVLPDLRNRPAVLWFAGKVVASMLVAASAALIFLTVLRFLSTPHALLLALAYGLGTCAWSTSSQALWQHGPDAFFLALGAYLLVRLDDGWGAAAGCGAAYACATACRPSSGLVLAAVGVYLLVARRRRLGPFVLAAAVPVALLMAYNVRYFGAPLQFGQTVRGLLDASALTGRPGVWQTPLLVGLAGHLVSPSRGLLVFSPFLGLGAWGAVRIWRRPAYAVLRPLTLAVVAVLLLSSKWYFWWGGWSFGYRLIVDTVGLIVLFLAPVLPDVLGRRWLRTLFVALLAWSVAVQVLGAFAYNLRGWNARAAGYVVQVPGEPPEVVAGRDEAEQRVRSRGARIVRVLAMDVSSREYRWRLWSWRDNPIVYYVLHFAEARREKHDMMRRWLADPSI